MPASGRFTRRPSAVRPRRRWSTPCARRATSCSPSSPRGGRAGRARRLSPAPDRGRRRTRSPSPRSRSCRSGRAAASASASSRPPSAGSARSGEDLVLVRGHPAYYRRFGFSPEPARALRTPWDGPYMQALALTPRGREAAGSRRFTLPCDLRAGGVGSTRRFAAGSFAGSRISFHSASLHSGPGEGSRNASAPNPLSRTGGAQPANPTRTAATTSCEQLRIMRQPTQILLGRMRDRRPDPSRPSVRIEVPLQRLAVGAVARSAAPAARPHRP